MHSVNLLKLNFSSILWSGGERECVIGMKHRKGNFNPCIIGECIKTGFATLELGVNFSFLKMG